MAGRANGQQKRLPPVTDRDRLAWAHDRMLSAIRKAIRDPNDRALVTAALARAQEYDELYTSSISTAEAERRARIGAANRRNATERLRASWQTRNGETE